MDCDTPLAIFARLQQRDCPRFLLESAEGGETWARYSLMGVGALVEVTGRASGVHVRYADGLERVLPRGLESLRQLLAEMRGEDDIDHARFPGGLVGYVCYDAVRDFESIPDSHHDPDAALFRFIMPRALCVYDNFQQELRLTAFESGHHLSAAAASDAASALMAELDGIEALLSADHAGGLERCVSTATEQPPQPVTLSSNTTREAFEASVDAAKEYIRAGDIFQVVLSQRFEAQGVDATPLDVYRRLRRQNPSPYMFFFEWGDETLVGASPEVMVRLSGRRAELRPIAGTRRRGETVDEDLALEAELRADPKEIAEHVMLLDLGRNDLGRVCRVGTVEIPERMVIERYSRVMHLVSHVRAELDQGKDWLDLFGATFPAGTLSGAPKIRAMEIIDELEPTRRNHYGGAVGFIGFDGDMDMCITIRTIHTDGETFAVQAGAGVVADSVPAHEYDETVNKARALLRAIGAEWDA